MGWLIAGIVLAVLLRTRRQLKVLTELAFLNSNPETNPNPGVSGASSLQQVYELSVLHLELGRLRVAEAITDARYMELAEHVDAVWSTIVYPSWAEPQSMAWSKSRDAAWALLLLHRTALSPLPPWHPDMETAGVEAWELTLPAPLDSDIAQPVAMPSLSLAAEMAISEAVAPPIAIPEPPTSVSPAPADVEAAVATPSGYALDPTPPSAVERALQAVSGWPALLIPFMVQNIGWFIGGFCFVAGSVFLVSYTTGFAKSLTIFTVLFAYTLLVLWAGYQLGRRRPELATSSRVLLTIGALLVPLNIAAAVRLIVTGLPAAGPVALGCLSVALCLGAFYYAIVLVSGSVDRTLQSRHPQLFLALAAVQLTVPLLTLWPSWPVLALLHTMLLGLLIYGFARFMQDGLHAIFIEHRTTTYYAAGTLVYAGLVSFVHLTWGHQGRLALPPGYYGPFLILLSGVLFYVDAQLKQWVTRDSFLSRVSFAIYGLSILALFAGVGTPVTQVLTLVLAIVLYAAVMWQYVTLPPLYMLLGCSGWLYHTVVLSWIPFAGYFLASVPGLAGLFFWSWRALRFQSPVLAQMSYRIGVLSGLGLAGWSISHAQPGLVAMATSLMVMVLAFLGPHYIPAPLFSSLPIRRGKAAAPAPPGHGHRTAWHYAGMLAAVVAMAYAPLWLGLAWATQLAVGLLLLAQWWTLIGMRQLRTHRQSAPAAATEAWFNGGLLTLVLFLMAIVGLGSADITANRALPLLLAFGGVVLLQSSWTLGHQWLLYGALLLWGAAGMAVKLTYFPQSGSGTTSLSVALALWAILWWVERTPLEVMALLRERAEMRRQAQPPPVLLWRWPASLRPYPEIVCRPLQHAMLLLGVVGLLQVGRHILTGEPEWSGVVSAGLGAVLTLLVTGRLRWGWLLPLAIGMGLGSGLGLAYQLGVSTSAGLSLVGTLYALGVWRVGLWLSCHPLVIRCCRLLRLRGNRDALELTTYRSAFGITSLSLLVSLGQYGLVTPHLSLLGSLIATMVFLWLSGQRYRRRLNVYLLLGIGAFGTVLCYLWSFYVDVASALPMNRWVTLLTDPGFGLTLLLVGLGLWGIARTLTHHVVSHDVERVEASIDAVHDLYLAPLRVVAVSLTLVAAMQQLGLAWLASFGVAETGQLLSIGVLGLSSVTLLLANHELGKPVISFAGMLGGVLTLLWAQGLGVHGSPVCLVGLLEPSCADPWFTLAWIAGVTACLARYLSPEPRWERLYRRPLYLTAATAYVWAVWGAIELVITAPSRAVAPLPWLLLTLSLALIPVVHRLPKAAVVRGLGMGLLLTGSVVSVLAMGGWHTVDGWWLTGWAFALWGLGNVALPRYNARWPHWHIAPGAWPWFGLSLLGIRLALWWGYWPGGRWPHPLLLGGYLTACALYLLCLLRNSRWAGMPWLAVLALMGAGVAYNFAWTMLPASTPSVWLLCFGLGHMVWLNLLLWGVSGWRRYGSAVAARLAWHDHDLGRPLLVGSLAGLLIGVLGLAALETVAVLWEKLVTDSIPWASVATIGVAMTLSCVHRLGLQRDALAGHVAIAAGFCALLAVWLGLAMQWHLVARGVHLPLFLALWSALLSAVEFEWERPRWGLQGLDRIRQPVSRWLVLSPPAAIVTLGLFPQVSLGELLLILTVFGGVSAYMGWQRRQAAWLFVAISTLVVALHALWFFWVPLYEMQRLMPGYALQLAGLMWLAGWLRSRVERPEIEQALYGQQWLLAVLALGTWIWHGFQGLGPLMSQVGLGETVMAIAAPLLLIAFGIGQAKRTQRAAWVYGVATLSGMLALYVRLSWLGLAPVQVWDTALLIGAAYAVLALHRLTPSRPILHLVMVLPILALGTIPLQLNSPHASGTLLMIGVLYLGMRRATGHVLPLYLGVTALNVGLYLWVPHWAHRFHLGQLYMIPAAMSMLWLLHFHRRDVRPTVLHSVRLATMSVLYASATSDVFLRASVMVFVAALGLSLGGIIVGIALRTRAFLYAGIAFFVLNVAGQLVLLFPEQRLGKAVVLLTLGTGITGAMIWFNAQRESILQRLRIFRSDLVKWE